MVSICCSRFFDGGSLKIVLLHHFTAAAQFLKMDTSPHESPPTLLEKDTFGLQIAGPPLSHMFFCTCCKKNITLGTLPTWPRTRDVCFLFKNRIQSRHRAVEPEGSLRSWLLQANEQNYLLIELNLREEPTADREIGLMDWWVENTHGKYPSCGSNLDESTDLFLRYLPGSLVTLLSKLSATRTWDAALGVRSTGILNVFGKCQFKAGKRWMRIWSLPNGFPILALSEIG